eukprot:m.122960 g.122960  ORF g.122960 m.122960 type:complete len:253 (+) comp37809_c0_seq24:384-1142(+)
MDYPDAGPEWLVSCIKPNIAWLCDNLTVDLAFLHHLMSKDLLTSAEVEKVEGTSESERKTHLLFFEILRGKGPEVLEKLFSALEESNRSFVVSRLRESEYFSSKANPEENRGEPSSSWSASRPQFALEVPDFFSSMHQGMQPLTKTLSSGGSKRFSGYQEEGSQQFSGIPEKSDQHFSGIQEEESALRDLKSKNRELERDLLKKTQVRNLAFMSHCYSLVYRIITISGSLFVGFGPHYRCYGREFRSSKRLL